MTYRTELYIKGIIESALFLLRDFNLISQKQMSEINTFIFDKINEHRQQKQ